MVRRAWWMGVVPLACVEKLPDTMEERIPAAVERAFERACDGAGCHEGAQAPRLVPFDVAVLDQNASDGKPYVAFDPDLSQSKIGELIVSGEMPPGGGADPADLAVILAWLAGVPFPPEDDSDTDEDMSAEETGSSTPSPVDETCAGPATASRPPAFTDVYPIFAARCATLGCHVGALAPVLDDAADAEASLLGKATRVDLAFVEPGRPEDSFLWLKLIAAESPAALEPFGANGGLPMPVGEALCAADLLRIYAWILGLP